MDTMAWIELCGSIIIPVAYGAYVLLQRPGNAARRQAEEAKTAAQDVADDLAKFKLDVSKDYVTKNDFKDALHDLKEEFRRGLAQHNDQLGALFRKLDNIMQRSFFDGKQ